MADVSRRYTDLTEHPDALEMRERYERVLAGPPAVAVDGLVLLAGIYLAISPWVVNGFDSTSRLAVANLIVGVALAVLGLALTMTPARVYRLSWTVVAIGIWVIITPWVVGPDTDAVIWNNVVTGVVITALGLAAIGMLVTGSRGAKAPAAQPK